MSCLVQLTRHTRLMHETPGFFAGLDTLDSHLPGREQEPQELGLVEATGQVLIRWAASCRFVAQESFPLSQECSAFPPNELWRFWDGTNCETFTTCSWDDFVAGSPECWVSAMVLYPEVVFCGPDNDTSGLPTETFHRQSRRISLASHQLPFGCASRCPKACAQLTCAPTLRPLVRQQVAMTQLELLAVLQTRAQSLEFANPGRRVWCFAL